MSHTAGERWRLIIDRPLPGAANMARDEALALGCAQGEGIPVVRFYQWQPAAVSLGRFQRSSAIDRAACQEQAIDIIRRPSGGRALLHDHELTYTVVARTDHPHFAQSILLAYQQISTVLLLGLEQLGVPAELTPKQAQPVGASAACFEIATSYELAVQGRKLVGSAQMRRDGVVLQHGALPLVGHARQLATLLADAPAQLGERMIALDQAAGRPIGFDEAVAAFTSGFAQAWGIHFEPGSLTPQELALAEQLEHEKYRSESWTFSR